MKQKLEKVKESKYIMVDWKINFALSSYIFRSQLLLMPEIMKTRLFKLFNKMLLKFSHIIVTCVCKMLIFNVFLVQNSFG